MRGTPSETSRRARVAAFTVTWCVLAIAACGSSSQPPTTTSSSPLAASHTGSAPGVRFAACVRAHGVPNFRDPTSTSQAAPAGTVNKRSPAFRRAQRSCQSIQAELASAKPHPTRARQLREAECMRADGVTNYPDPLPGGGFNIPSTINPQSPTFLAAANACGKP